MSKKAQMKISNKADIEMILDQAEAAGVDWEKVDKEHPDTMATLGIGFDKVVAHADQLLAKAKRLKKKTGIQLTESR